MTQRRLCRATSVTWRPCCRAQKWSRKFQKVPGCGSASAQGPTGQARSPTQVTTHTQVLGQQLKSAWGRNHGERPKCGQSQPGIPKAPLGLNPYPSQESHFLLCPCLLQPCLPRPLVSLEVILPSTHSTKWCWVLGSKAKPMQTFNCCDTASNLDNKGAPAKKRYAEGAP